MRTPGVDYDTAPVGNDVDTEDDLYVKWRAAGSFIVDDIGSSVDECTFIPMYPKDPRFGAGRVG